ncbi:MAG: hypothetical protein AAFV45_14980 [Pseudomonadota bacterium]
MKPSDHKDGETPYDPEKMLGFAPTAKELKRLWEAREANWRMGLVITGFFLFVISFVNVDTTAGGMALEWARFTDDFEASRWYAVMVAGGVSLCVFGLWSIMFAMGPSMLRNWAGVCFFALTVGFTAYTIGQSSKFTFDKLVYESVLPRYAGALVNQASNEVDVLSRVTQEARGQIPTFEAFAADTCYQAGVEGRDGSSTGTGSGKGAGFSALTSACRGLTAFKDAMVASVASAENSMTELSGALERVRMEILDRSKSAIEKEQAALVALTQMDTDLRKYRATGLGSIMENGPTTLRNLVPDVGADSGLPRRTVAFVNGLRGRMEGLARGLENLRSSQGAAAAYSMPERQSLGELTWGYIGTYPGFALMSVFLDLVALFSMILFLLVGCGTPKPLKNLNRDREQKPPKDRLVLVGQSARLTLALSDQRKEKL